MTVKVPFATQSYQSRSLPLSAQRLVNLFAEAAPKDATTQVCLFGTPGLTLFGTIGSGPIRCLHVMGTVLYCVSGDQVYSVNSAGTGTLLGQLAGVERTNSQVFAADNGTQLVLINSDGKGTVYDADAATLSPITDSDFPRASSVSYVDGYFVFTRPNTGQWFISDLLEATSYDALDFATAESYPDDLVRVYVDHREVWLFGKKSTEVWTNTGRADFPFERISGAILEKGCAAAGSVARADNSVFWLADDGMIYRAQGYQPQRISTHAIEHAMEGYAQLSDGLAFTYAQEGHSFYVLTFPAEGVTWVYDASTQLWHERESRDGEGRSLGRWRINAYGDAYNQHVVGDYATGKLYTLDLDEATENGIQIRREAVSVSLAAIGARLTMARLEIEMETGVGTTTGDGMNPTALLSWSDDGGRIWSNEKPASLGAIGGYRRRARWYRCGQFRERYLRIVISDPVKVAILAANAEMEQGIP
jgi:hypothetical protein